MFTVRRKFGVTALYLGRWGFARYSHWWWRVPLVRVFPDGAWWASWLTLSVWRDPANEPPVAASRREDPAPPLMIRTQGV